MQIENLPEKLLSKLNNIYFVALVNTAHMNDDFTQLDDVLNVILRDIRILETKGLKVDGKDLKGTLAQFVFDNLGGNELFGFVASFNANYFCRICFCTKEEHRELVREDLQLLRTIEHYDKCVEFIENSETEDFTTSMGVKKSCPLNKLKYYHIITNKSVDLMHDCNEGAIPFALHRLFSYFLDKKLLTQKQLVAIVRDFNYGVLYKRNVPSQLDIKKPNLGQNATQLYCLFIHIPFIMADLRVKLESVWPSFGSLLKAITIMYSSKITESVVELENLIEIHLTNIRKHFDKNTPPKDHFLTHYPLTIRCMGP
ncbi:uncharacterized protein LOC129565809 [Sitodiplosis mosellana]|uniref:uncharacterized protein LOC129565809 n=1 Tax=Sitodiplosis mosellana TaxID=263140 RepID=UPI002444CF5F|nr:uncharacterized protein LOC129565809 [Sitodiplosis mosellana]